MNKTNKGTDDSPRLVYLGTTDSSESGVSKTPSRIGRGITQPSAAWHNAQFEECWLPAFKEASGLTGTPTQPSKESLTMSEVEQQIPQTDRGQSNPEVFIPCDEFGVPYDFTDTDYPGYSTELAPVVDSYVVEMVGGIITTVPDGCNVLGERFKLKPLTRTNWRVLARRHSNGELVCRVDADTFRLTTQADLENPQIPLYLKEELING